MSDQDQEITSQMKAVRVPSFNGQEDKFHHWWTRFEGFANAQGFEPAINDEPEKDLPNSSVVIENESTAQAAARRRNKQAVYWLGMAFEGDEAMLYYFKGMNKDWPKGASYLIVKALMARYIPRDDIATYYS
jgi:hypothetical protein